VIVIRHRLSKLALFAAAVAACLDQLSPDTSPLMQVHPPWAVINPGDTIHLSAFLTDSASGPVTAAWSSTHPTVAAVDSVGRVRALRLGTAVMTAQRGARNAQGTVTVAPPVLVGAGDIADCGLQGEEATAAIIRSIPGFVFTAGDNAYQRGAAEEFANCYHPTWGRFRARTRPTPGEHDYQTPGAAGYFDYFGPSAGPPPLGYYSYRVGAWHVVALNSVMALDASSPQMTWLRQDLLARDARCVMAYAYHPRFSSGRHGSVPRMQPAWEVLHAAGAALVVSGRDHLYERFAPQSPDGNADPSAGVRQFVVGTGGGLLTHLRARQPNSEKVITGRYGVLKVALGDSTYHWEFLVAPGGQIADSGTAPCH
jgi:hypothetical protein